MSVRIPKYRLHKATGQALVEIRGQRTYLGKYDSPSSREKYRQIIAELMSSTPKAVATFSKSLMPLQIDELVMLYFEFTKGYYVKDGQQTNEVVAIRAALRRLRKMYGTTHVNDFGPKAYKLVRESLIQERLSRKYVNDSMARVSRMFRWAVAEELVPPTVFQAISSVPGLRKGRTNARETAPIGPVNDEAVEATLPFLPSVVADMVQLQRLTGMRPAKFAYSDPPTLTGVARYGSIDLHTTRLSTQASVGQLPLALKRKISFFGTWLARPICVASAHAIPKANDDLLGTRLVKRP